MGSSRHILATGGPILEAQLSERDASAVLAERQQLRIAAAFAAGVEEGRGTVLADAADVLDEAVGRLDAFRERASLEVAHDAVELAVEIARQLVQRQVQAGDYDLERMVRGALDAADIGRGDCTVHIAPEDHARLSDIVFREGTRLVADPEMAAGDVHVETPRGLMVRELGPTIDSIREQLLEDLV